MKLHSALLILIGSPLLLLGCSKKLLTGIGQESVTDSKGNTYSVRVMPDGKQWMTQNLNIDMPGSYCYNDLSENCSMYGRLYTWEAAKEGCKMLGKEWRLPTNNDWEKMAQHYGGVRTDPGQDGKKAYKSLIHMGDSQLNILFGGTRDVAGDFSRIEAHGFYWTATECDSAHALFYNLGKGGQLVNRHEGEKLRAASVRCVR
jgi:uncharacterized protein (TIGR02145 family)